MTATPAGWKGLDTVALWDAGVTASRGVVRIPYRTKSGLGHNARLWTPRRQWWERSNLPVIPFGLERAPRDRRGAYLFLAEGESDALALRGAYAALRGRPVVALGIPGAGMFRDSWIAHLTGYAGMYVFADADSAGDRLAVRIAARFPAARFVRLPRGQDVRDVLQAPGGADQLDAAIMAADEAALLAAVIRQAPTITDARRLLTRAAA